MTTAIQFRRGSTNDHTLFTGLEGEITVDTSKKTAVVHDNITAGGSPLAREDLANVSLTTITDKGIAKSNMENVSCEDIANRNIAKQDLSNVATNDITKKGIMKSDCSNADHLASETEIGPTQFATEEEATDNTLTTKALNPKNAVKAIKQYCHLPENYISGFTITKSDNTYIKIDCGEARCVNNKYDIKLTEPIIKNINTYWEAGSNFGGLEENVTITANSKYYVFAITTDDGLTDIIISDEEELDLTTSVIKNNNFVSYRRIGSFYTDNNIHINEQSITDSNDTMHVNINDYIEFSPISTYLYTAPFNGMAFYVSCLRNGAYSDIKLNNKIIATFHEGSVSFSTSNISFPIKKNDIISIFAPNDINRSCILRVFKERSI